MKAIVLLIIILTGACAVAAPVKTGGIVPELPAAPWIWKNPVKFADYYGKKPVVVYVWSANYDALRDWQNICSLVTRFGDRVGWVGIGVGTSENLSLYPRLKELIFPVFADEKPVISKLLFRERDPIPGVALINKEGKLCWRGSTRKAGVVIEQLIDGSFNLKEKIRQENFSDQISSLIRAKKFAEAVKELDQELLRYPGNSELIVLKVRLQLFKLKQRNVAIATLQEAQRLKPEFLPFYELEYRVISNDKLDLRKKFYSRILANFSNKPRVLLKFAKDELSLPWDKVNPALALQLARNAWKSPKFTNKKEQGEVALEVAKVFHSCGRIDLALELAQRAAIFLKNTKGEKSALKMANFYNNLLIASSKFKLD